MKTTPETRASDGGHPQAELLPWLLNGSLEERERESLRHHLADCASCHRELADTVQAWQLVTEHVPSLALAEYALGLEPEEIDARRIERHLEVCPSCREELALVTSDRVADFEAARARRRSRSDRPASWRHLAVAAGLAAVLAAGAWIGSRAEHDASSSADQLAVRGPEAGSPTASAVSAASAASGPSVVFSDGFESGSIAAWSATHSTEFSTEPNEFPARPRRGKT